MQDFIVQGAKFEWIILSLQVKSKRKKTYVHECMRKPLYYSWGEFFLSRDCTNACMCVSDRVLDGKKGEKKKKSVEKMFVYKSLPSSLMIFYSVETLCMNLLWSWTNQCHFLTLFEVHHFLLISTPTLFFFTTPFLNLLQRMSECGCHVRPPSICPVQVAQFAI